MIKNGQILKGTIQYIDEFGNGIMRNQKDTILVQYAIAKEVVKVRIIKHIQKGYIAEIVEVIKANAQRIQPACPIYAHCGCCQLMHLQVKSQGSYKKKAIEELCRKEKVMLNIQDVIDMENPYHYRNKIIIGFTSDKRKGIQAGFYEEFSHRIIPYEKCLLHPLICDEIISTIVKLVKKFNIEPYHEDKRNGFLRHVLIRYGETTQQIMVVLVVNSKVFAARKSFVQAVLQEQPQITTIVQNINTRKTSVVLGDEERILYGPGYIEDELCGNNFRISPKSFYQINHKQSEVLYRKAIAQLDIKGNENVLDAYCGIGSIGMYVARFVKEVVGVEINKDAIQDANQNAKANHIKNIRFLCGDAGLYMQKQAMQGKSLDIVIMDPPRSGSTETFIKSIAKLRVKQVLYISCNPQTQLRDIKIFQRYAYAIKGDLIPLDLFPFTNHIESIVKLVRIR